MDENTGFAAYALFNSIKLHFTTKSYDYFKYNGKTSVTKDTFVKNKGKYQFYKLSRKYSLDELKDYYVSNFIKNNVSWVGELMGPDGEEIYTKWQKRTQSLTYLFENDMNKILDSNDAEELLRVKEGQYPLLYDMLSHEDITIESFVILNDILNFFPMWKRKIQDDIIWPTFCLKCEKYTPFVEYDKDKFKSILREKIKEYA